MSWFDSLTQQYGLPLTDPEPLMAALVHPSLTCALRPRPLSTFERLEFLGDRVLNLTVAQYLYEAYPKAHQGELSQRHTFLVRAETLTKIAKTLKLAEAIQYQANMQGSDAPLPDSILADALEVVFGFVLQAAGYEHAQKFVLQVLQPHLDALSDQTESMLKNPKSQLQEHYLQHQWGLPVYAVTRVEGVDHAPVFMCTLHMRDDSLITAQAGTKRQAETLVAQKALDHLQRSLS